MSSSAQDPIPDLDLDNTFGALFIGVIIAALLFGVTNVQTFIYLQTNRGTGMTLYKLIVTCLWIFDALHLALITHCVYFYLVTNYANLVALTEVVWSFKLQVVIDVFIIYGVHVLYAHRIWILSKGRSRVLPAILGVILIVTSAVAIAFIWAIYQCNTFGDLLSKKWAVYMTLSTMAFNDLIIASSLCYLLTTSRSGFSSMDSLITKLMVYIINTGCLTSVASIVAIITSAVMPANFISVAFQFFIPKLYVNSFLALLNARNYRQPERSENIDVPQFRAHGSLVHNKGSAEDSQDSRKNVYQHPYDHDDDPYMSPRLIHAVTPPRTIAVTMDIHSFSSA